MAGAYGEFGERHDPETHLIPLVLQVALGERESISVFGEDYPTPDGTCVRDYIHVADLAEAHLAALEAATAGEHLICNLGNGNGFSVREVVETVRKVTGAEIPEVVAPRRAATRRCSSPRRAPPTRSSAGPRPARTSPASSRTPGTSRASTVPDSLPHPLTAPPAPDGAGRGAWGGVRRSASARVGAVGGRGARAPGVYTPGEMPSVQLPVAHAGRKPPSRPSGPSNSGHPAPRSSLPSRKIARKTSAIRPTASRDPFYADA